MRIRFRIWRKLVWVGNIFAIPAVLFLSVQPDVGTERRWLEIAIYIFMFSFCGLGALVAIFQRAGVIQFIYSEADKRSLIYRMSKYVAEMERDHRRQFSETYYRSFEITPPNQKGSNNQVDGLNL